MRPSLGYDVPFIIAYQDLAAQWSRRALLPWVSMGEVNLQGCIERQPACPDSMHAWAQLFGRSGKQN